MQKLNSMAFQSGSQIRPELGNADYSGFARAAEIQASTLAQLGATIGGAIQARAEKKKEKATKTLIRLWVRCVLWGIQMFAFWYRMLLGV